MRVEPAEFLHRNLGKKATQANKDAVLTKKHVIEQWICVYIEMGKYGKNTSMTTTVSSSDVNSTFLLLFYV